MVASIINVHPTSLIIEKILRSLGKVRRMCSKYCMLISHYNKYWMGHARLSLLGLAGRRMVLGTKMIAKYSNPMYVRPFQYTKAESTFRIGYGCQSPGARFSKATETFRARKAIAKSGTLRLQSCFIHIF